MSKLTLLTRCQCCHNLAEHSYEVKFNEVEYTSGAGRIVTNVINICDNCYVDNQADVLLDTTKHVITIKGEIVSYESFLAGRRDICIKE